MANKAVVDGVLQHVSASQLKTYLDCKRKWAIDKVFGIRPPEQPADSATNVGQAAHTVLQAHYEGNLTDALWAPLPDVLGQSMRKLLADPRLPVAGTTGLLVEHPRDYNLGITIGGVPVQGRIDLLDESDLAKYRIIDLKTTNKKTGKKSKAKLTTDLQLNLYGHWAFVKNPALAHVQFTHAYALKELVHADVVDTDLLTRDHCEAQVADLVAVVADMAADARATEWAEVEPDLTCCERYGPKYRCPYFDMCHGTSDSLSTMLTKRAEESSMHEGGLSVDRDQAVAKNWESIRAMVRPGTVDVVAQPDVVPWLHLHINSTPVKLSPPGPITYLADLVKQRQDVIAAQYKVTDVREVKYAEGVAKLVAEFRRNPPTGHVVAEAVGLQALVLEVLLPLASAIEKGWG